MKVLVIMVTVCPLVYAQDQSLAEKITHVGEGLVEGYTQPFTTAYGTAVVTGLFHSAYSHDLFGFDIGLRAMYIHIPNSAKYFSGTALLCSLQAGTVVYDTVVLDSLSTIFGPEDETVVSTENAIGIPPSIPGGFNLSGVPFLMPQLNVGLIAGSEVAIRYLPFTYEGSKMSFLGIGIKQELNKLPGLNAVPLPFAIALGGAYQTFNVKDSEGAQILNTSTWCLQLLASKRIVVFEPFVAVGLEGTKLHFTYDFVYEIPTPIPGYTETITQEVNVETASQTNYRAVAGFTLRMGFFYVHYDFNLSSYKTHNVIAGITIR